jgi:hypothetical protein
MTTSSIIDNVTLLEGPENLFDWRIEMKGVLMTIGADTIVSGLEPRPRVLDLDSKDSKLDASHGPILGIWQYQQKKADEWDLRDRKARGFIVSSISRELKDEILVMGTSKEMWDHLNHQFTMKRPELQQSVMREIFGLQLRPGDDAQRHLDKFTSLTQQAIATGEPISDKRKCDLFFDTLPLEYIYSLKRAINSSTRSIPAIAGHEKRR